MRDVKNVVLLLIEGIKIRYSTHIVASLGNSPLTDNSMINKGAQRFLPPNCSNSNIKYISIVILPICY